MRSFRSGQFTPLVPLLPLPQTRNRSFGLRAFTPLIPLCPSPKTEKEILKFFKTSFLSENKRKGIHQLTRHIWLRLFTKASTHICLRYATANIRYAETLAVIVNVQALNARQKLNLLLTNCIILFRVML